MDRDDRRLGQQLGTARVLLWSAVMCLLVGTVVAQEENEPAQPIGPTGLWQAAIECPGGSIRFTPSASNAALAGSSPELGLAMQLMQDFRYQLLRSDVFLDRAGNLQLGLSLGGHNPGYNDGQRVNFNINLEQNLFPLLQSLRLSDTLVEQLQEKAQ